MGSACQTTSNKQQQNKKLNYIHKKCKNIYDTKHLIAKE